MSKLTTIGYSLDDVTIVPAALSEVESRKDVNPYLNYGERYGGPFKGDKLPIFVAPMESVVDETNYKVFLENGVIPVISRSAMQRLTLDERIDLSVETFVAISLDEARVILDEWSEFKDSRNHFICVDVAQGGMKKLIETCKYLKEKYQNLVIMTGNIANPDTYWLYCKAGIDFVRVSIGTGNRCTTSCATGIYYPQATLLDMISQVKRFSQSMSANGFLTNIVLDGGIDWADKVAKGIALGADAVMIGKLFAECEEACGEVGYATSEDGFMNDVYFTREEWDKLKDCVPNHHKFKPYRMYSGMSHRSSQKKTGGDGSKVSEGICKPVVVKYDLPHLLENFESWLRSTMSYTNSRTLKDLKDAEMVVLGGNGKMVYSK